MDRTLFTDGMYLDDLDARSSDLANTVSTKAAQVAARATELGAYGVLFGLVLQPVAGALQVSAGQALDADGLHLQLTSGVNLPVAVTDAGRYVLARRLSVDATEKEQIDTGAQYSTRTDDSCQLYLADAKQAGAVTLGQVVSVGSDGVPVLTLLEREEWSVAVSDGQLTDDRLVPDGALLTHASARGTGVATPTNPHGLRYVDIGGDPNTTPRQHERKQHVDGITPRGTTAGHVTISSTNVVVAQIVSPAAIVVDGVRLLAGALSTTIAMSALDVVARPALYTIWVDRTGATGKTLRADWVGYRGTIGLQLVDVELAHELGVFTIVVQNGTDGLTARWADGPAVRLTGDALVELVNHLGQKTRWWVDYSALPSTGASDVVELLADTDGAAHFPLGHVWSDGISQLGYGDEGTGGNVLDVRSFGRTDLSNLGVDVQQAIADLSRLYRFDALIEGGDLEILGFNATVRSGTAWIGGQIVPFSTTTLALPYNTLTFVIVMPDGQVVMRQSDPDAQDVSVKGAFARIARITTSRSGLAAWQDDRILLRDQDDRLRLGTAYQYDTFVQQIARLVMPQGANGYVKGQTKARTRLVHAPGADGYGPISIYATQFGYDRLDPQTGLTVERLLQGFEVALNVEWTGSLWAPVDTTCDAAVWSIDQDGVVGKVKFQGNFGGGNWHDTQADGTPTWDDVPFRFDARRGALGVGTVDSNINDDLMTVPGGIPNAATPVSLVKAWALLEVTAGQVRPLRGFNVRRQLVNSTVNNVTGDSTPCVMLPLAGALSPVSGGDPTPNGAVIVLDDQGLGDPMAAPATRICGQLVTVSGQQYVKLASTTPLKADGSDPGGSPNQSQLIYLMVTGPQVSTADPTPVFPGYSQAVRAM